MKLYKISSPGCPAEEFAPEPGDKINIGTEGRGRKMISIPVLGDETGSGYAVAKTKLGHIIKKTDTRHDDTRCLAVIDSGGAYKQGSHYCLSLIEGDVQELETGHGAHGIAGRAGSYEEYLAIVHDGAVFSISSKYSRHYYEYSNGAWTMYSEAEWLYRCTLKEVEEGEIEWL